MIWNVIDTINLFHSGIGLCDWQIHMCHEGIVCVPEGMQHTLAVGVSAGARDLGGAVSHIDMALSRGGEQELEDTGDEGWLRFPFEDLQRIVLRKKMLTGSKLTIELQDGTVQKFATDNLGATHQARWVCQSVCPDGLYVEEKFKKPVDPAKAFRD